MSILALLLVVSILFMLMQFPLTIVAIMTLIFGILKLMPDYYYAEYLLIENKNFAPSPGFIENIGIVNKI